MNLSTNPAINAIITKHALENKSYDKMPRLIKNKMNNIVAGIRKYNNDKKSYLNYAYSKQDIKNRMREQRRYWARQGVSDEEMDKRLDDFWTLYFKQNKFHDFKQTEEAIKVMRRQLKWREQMKAHIEKMYFYINNNGVREHTTKYKTKKSCRESIRKTIDKDIRNTATLREQYKNDKNPYIKWYMFQSNEFAFLTNPTGNNTKQNLRSESKIMNNLHRVVNDNRDEIPKVLLDYAEKNYVKNQARKIETWFLECKYNPAYKYCRKWVDEEYDNY